MMVSQPKHPFWEAMFRALLEQVPRIIAAQAGGEHPSPVDTTGPVMLTKIFEKHPDAFMVGRGALTLCHLLIHI